MSALICSMHIQKTAGKSLLAAMQGAYEPDEVVSGMDERERDQLRRLWKADPERARSLKVVHGHMPWGFHGWFDRPFVYIGFVREPVERVVSYYYFCRSEPTHNCHALANELDLESFVEANPHLAIDNAMTRYFAGRITDMAPRPTTVSQLDRPAMYQEAIENIRADFPVVGVLEHMDRSMEMLRMFFGWPEQETPRVNVNRARPSIEEVPQRLRDRIRELNRLDVELYAFCLRRLERDYPVFCG